MMTYKEKKLVELLERCLKLLKDDKITGDNLEERIIALEKNSHVPVIFIEDENGFLKVNK